jgi:hypothetical protein
MHKPKWIHYTGGAYAELAYGLRIAVNEMRGLDTYRVTFAGVQSMTSYKTVDEAKKAGVAFANGIVQDLIWCLLELEHPDANGEGLVPK